MLVLVPDLVTAAVLGSVEGAGIAEFLRVDHLGVGLGQAQSQGGGGGVVDSGLQQAVLSVHVEARRAKGDLQGQLAPVGHAGGRVGKITQSLVHAGEGGDGGVGVGSACIGVGDGGPLVVVGHEDHLVGGLANAPVVKAGVPGVGLDADIEGFPLGQGGVQLF